MDNFKEEIREIAETPSVEMCKQNLLKAIDLFVKETDRMIDGEKGNLIKELYEAYWNDVVSHLDNEDDYKLENLKNKSLDELEELYNKYIEIVEGIATFNRLQNEEGWEHVWED
jgi:hypothetical protein